MMRVAIFLAAILFCSGLIAESINAQRAKFNYQMFCMGCHTPDGMGSQYVPMLKNHIGYFLQSQQGRNYLVRVPGSANSALNDAQLAELLNWMIQAFGENSTPENIQPYSAEEVGRLRQEPLMEVLNYRKQLISTLDTTPTLDRTPTLNTKPTPDTTP